MDTKLIPCPCCGGEDISLLHKKVLGKPVEINRMRYWRVECCDCDTRTGDCFDDDAEIFGFKNGKEMAIARWNRRNYLPNQKKEIKLNTFDWIQIKSSIDLFLTNKKQAGKIVYEKGCFKDINSEIIITREGEEIILKQKNSPIFSIEMGEKSREKIMKADIKHGKFYQKEIEKDEQKKE